MNRLHRLFVWLCRINHCRGFGIQSPTDYRFVRYVVNEQWPYYAYEKLDAEASWLDRKLGHLCLRLANALQPTDVVDRAGAAPYLLAGCRKARVADDFCPDTAYGLAVVDVDDERLEQAVDLAEGHSVLMVRCIWRNPQRWQQLVGNPRTVVTFDLYYCGIAFFDTRRAKHNYIVNF